MFSYEPILFFAKDGETNLAVFFSSRPVGVDSHDQFVVVGRKKRCGSGFYAAGPGYFSGLVANIKVLLLFNFLRDGFLVLSLITPEQYFQEGMRRLITFFGR